MTQYYHTPIPLLAAADAATFRSPFGELDAAIYRCLGSGTSFPVSASEGDQFWRSDSNKGYLYDGASWQEISMGGATAGVVDVEGTAGEALSERDIVYCNSATPDGEWYKVDIDATAAVKISSHLGVVSESGGILSTATGTIRVAGVLGGFVGLTAGGLVYAHTTSGGYTQTKPTLTDGGAQKAIVIVGQAISTTEVLITKHIVEYAKRATLANNATLTIEHHADASCSTRLVGATILTTESGASIESYLSTNQDVGVPLRGPSGAGGTATITATGTDGAIGDVSDTEYWLAQSLTTITSGRLSQIQFTLRANLGSPTGDITWEIRTNNVTVPSSTILQTGTITPTPSAVNTITVTNGVFLATGTTYWLALHAPAQATNVAYSWDNQNASDPDGNRAISTDSGANWSADTYDCACTITTAAVSVGDKLGQGFQVTGAQTVGVAKLYLKKVGTPTGTATLRIETDNAGMPSGTLVDVSATTTLAESSVGTSYGWIAFTYATTFAISGSTQYHIVLSTDRATDTANYILWGSDVSAPSYANGAMAAEAAAAWAAESPAKDACFDICEASTDYDEPVTVGRWSGGTRDVAVRYDDGAAADETTMTTFKNVIGSSVDVTCIVRLP